MNTAAQVEQLERLIGQLEGLYSELSQLAKKSPNDSVNTFKLALINKVISAGNAILTNNYRPFPDFEIFDNDDLPTNSDVTMILTQYMEQAERYRSDNVALASYSDWRYIIEGKPSAFKAAPPSRAGTKK